jgi:3-oxoacyl-[acyl-carrier-protein] synthase III
VIIKGIAASLPERRVSNEEVIDLVRQYSRESFSGDLDRTLRIVRQLLHRSGSIERRWCDRHESPIDHVAMATREALSNCYLRRPHIELIVYVGVGRGFLEPSNSHMIANALGFRNADCFDVVEACMSWLRAVDMVDSFFKSGRYRNALIINAEFHTFAGGPHFPRFLTLKSADDVPYSYPSLTIGDAATATVLYPKEPDNFEFHFSSKPELSQYCTIPLEGFEEFCHPTPEIGKRGLNQFTSYAEPLFREGHPEVARIFKRDRDARNVDILVAHTSSYKEWTRAAQAVAMADRMYQIFPVTGNVVSASIPAGISLAIKEGKLERGMKVGAWVGSAGMSFGYSRFTY